MNATITKKTWLCDEENHRVVMIRLEIPNSSTGEDTAAHYEPGDHVAVYPNHTDSEVAFVMDHMTKKPANQDMLVQLYEYNQNEGENGATNVYKWSKTYESILNSF